MITHNYCPLQREYFCSKYHPLLTMLYSIDTIFIASARLNLLETYGTTGVAGRTRSSRILVILGLPLAYWNLDRYLVDPVELPSPRQI